MPKKKEPTEMTRTEGARTALMSLPGVADIARKFEDTKLSVELSMPDEEMLALLVGPGKRTEEAKTFTVDSDDDYKLAKATCDSLKDEADKIESGRTNGTKGINSLKAGWDALFTPGRNDCKSAVQILEQKMRAYEAKKKEEDRRAREEQQREAERQREDLRRQATEHEKKAAKLRSPERKREELQNAESLRQAADMIPEEFGASETSAPRLGSGGKQERWVGEVTDDTDFLNWLWKEPLWQKKIVQYLQSGLNDLADAAKDTKQIPGFRAQQVSSYRREARKRDQGKA